MKEALKLVVKYLPAAHSTDDVAYIGYRDVVVGRDVEATHHQAQIACLNIIKGIKQAPCIRTATGKDGQTKDVRSLDGVTNSERVNLCQLTKVRPVEELPEYAG